MSTVATLKHPEDDAGVHSAGVLRATQPATCTNCGNMRQKLRSATDWHSRGRSLYCEGILLEGTSLCMETFADFASPTRCKCARRDLSRAGHLARFARFFSSAPDLYFILFDRYNAEKIVHARDLECADAARTS